MYDGTTISTGASVSLDGYISGPGESGFEHLFAYMAAGDVEVPVFLGGGTPFFPDLAGDAPLLLDGPEVTPGRGVTHLRYRVRRG